MDEIWRNQDVAATAQRLLGCWLVRELDGEQLVGKIVEVEAYHASDAASHSFKPKTPRTEVLFGPPGYAYVYFTYGMHYCMNVVTGKDGEGSAVLIRAVEPLAGIAVMQARRPGKVDKQLTNGPAKLCQAFAIDKKYNGHDLHQAPLRLIAKPKIPANQIVQTTRIGITRDAHRPWRFYIKNNPFVSRT